MKIITVLCFLTFSVNAAVIKRQEHDNSGGGGIGGLTNIATLPKSGLLTPETQRAMRIEEIQPKVNPSAKRIRLTYGPFKIGVPNVSSLLH
jgi:hypothetical protein